MLNNIELQLFWDGGSITQPTNPYRDTEKLNCKSYQAWKGKYELCEKKLMENQWRKFKDWKKNVFLTLPPKIYGVCIGNTV